MIHHFPLDLSYSSDPRIESAFPTLDPLCPLLGFLPVILLNKAVLLKANVDWARGDLAHTELSGMEGHARRSLLPGWLSEALGM